MQSSHKLVSLLITQEKLSVSCCVSSFVNTRISSCSRVKEIGLVSQNVFPLPVFHSLVIGINLCANHSSLATYKLAYWLPLAISYTHTLLQVRLSVVISNALFCLVLTGLHFSLATPISCHVTTCY